MIICFKCTPETKRALDSLTAGGQYADYGEAITVAIHNLLVVHQEVDKSGLLILPYTNDPSGGSRTETSPLQAPTDAPLMTSDPAVANPRTSVPDLFQPSSVSKPPVIAQPPLDVFAGGQPVQLDRWLFGQYNKILPAKASCRALATLLLREQQALPVVEAAMKVAEGAVELGARLAALDRHMGRARDEWLSTAFPLDGDPEHKGRARFASQFVADINKNGQVTGLLADLKLINKVDRRSNTIALTQAGWEFASLTNPALDGSAGTNSRLGSGEIAFLLRHIQKHVPVEDFTYRTVLSAVSAGANTPSSLDAALRGFVPDDKELTEAFLSTQRSGAVSRMVDLGLLKRVRDGVKMLYVITDEGLHYSGRN